MTDATAPSGTAPKVTSPNATATDGSVGTRTTRRAPVMTDVARLAGVSHQTVSRVVNGHPQLRPATRLRVEEAIRQLGYRPNAAARALAMRRSATIGVIGTRSGFWGPSSVHRAIQAAGREAGFFVSSVNVPDLSREAIGGALEHLRRQGVEGIVLIGATEETGAVAREHEAHGVPVILVEGSPEVDAWCVGLDQVAGAVLATRHLLDLGHTGIVHLAGPLQWNEAQSRLNGWRSALHDAGPRPLTHLEGDWTAASGYRLGAGLARRRDVTAVFAANDQMAIGLLRALWEAGRSVPADISVVGFDDIPESEYVIPGLTTVRQDFATIGHRAIELLQHAIGGGAPDQDAPERLIRPELVVRGSTAGPAR